jgi:hypothetical protein
MDIKDYEPTATIIDDTPRPRAPQDTAARKRARAEADPTPATTRSLPMLLFPIALVAFALLGGMLMYGLSQPMRPLTIAPTAVPTQAFDSARVATFPATPAPRPTIAPTALPTPAELATAAPVTLTGRGLTIDVVEPTAAPSYIDNVGAQAPHSPRGGLCGPTGGDCAPGVPAGIDNNQYIANVGAQAPHRVR